MTTKEEIFKENYIDKRSIKNQKEKFRQIIRNWKYREADTLNITENQIEALLDKYFKFD